MQFDDEQPPSILPRGRNTTLSFMCGCGGVRNCQSWSLPFTGTYRNNDGGGAVGGGGKRIQHQHSHDGRTVTNRSRRTTHVICRSNDPAGVETFCGGRSQNTGTGKVTPTPPLFNKTTRGGQRRRVFYSQHGPRLKDGIGGAVLGRHTHNASVVVASLQQ